jgi:hypothetical protein
MVTHLAVSGALTAGVGIRHCSHPETKTLCKARQCGYDHLQQLVEELTGRRHVPQVLLSEQTFEQLQAGAAT